MNWGMISYEVPLSTCPDTYNGQPLMYAALASQKRHMAVYLTGIYLDEAEREAFEEAYRATGKRFDVGRSCVRFRSLEDRNIPSGINFGSIPHLRREAVERWSEVRPRSIGQAARVSGVHPTDVSLLIVHLASVHTDAGSVKSS